MAVAQATEEEAVMRAAVTQAVTAADGAAAKAAVAMAVAAVGSVDTILARRLSTWRPTIARRRWFTLQACHTDIIANNNNDGPVPFHEASLEERLCRPKRGISHAGRFASVA